MSHFVSLQAINQALTKAFALYEKGKEDPNVETHFETERAKNAILEFQRLLYEVGRFLVPAPQFGQSEASPQTVKKIRKENKNEKSK